MTDDEVVTWVRRQLAYETWLEALRAAQKDGTRPDLQLAEAGDDAVTAPTRVHRPLIGAVAS